MKYFKSLGLCLVAVFALSAAVVVATAAAEVPTFLFKEGGTKPDFSSKTGVGKLTTVVAGEEIVVECASATNTGEAVAGTDRAKNIAIVFSKCTSEIKGVKVECGTKGVITTNKLEGELGYIHEGTPLTVGFVLKPEAAGGLFAEFKCATVTIKVRGKAGGGVIAEVLPGSVGRLIDKGEVGLLTYKATGETQEPTSLKVLGTLVDELLLEANVGGAGYGLAAIHEEKNIELSFLESVEISD